MLLLLDMFQKTLSAVGRGWGGRCCGVPVISKKMSSCYRIYFVTLKFFLNG